MGQLQAILGHIHWQLVPNIFLGPIPSNIQENHVEEGETSTIWRGGHLIRSLQKWPEEMGILWRPFWTDSHKRPLYRSDSWRKSTLRIFSEFSRTRLWIEPNKASRTVSQVSQLFFFSMSKMMKKSLFLTFHLGKVSLTKMGLDRLG